MKSTVDGLYTVEELLTMAQRLVARLQDAGVTHVRDVVLNYDPANGQGVRLELGTADGAEDTIELDCDDLALPIAVAKLSVLRPLPSRRPGKAKLAKPGAKHDGKSAVMPKTILRVRPGQD